MTHDSNTPDFSHLPPDQRGRAERNHRIAQYEAEQAAAREPGPAPTGDPVADYFDGSTFINDEVEAAAREAAAVTAARGGNPYECREAAMKAAQRAVARSTDPLDNDDTKSLGQIVNGTTDDVALHEEIRLLREQLAARDAKINAADSVQLTDAEYFAARKEGKLSGIRHPKWGTSR